MSEKPTIQFLGGTETVTGSKFVLQTEGLTVMVDCGLFQGLKKLREMNWQHPVVDPKTIDAVLLTHGHLDHCGYLPKLVNLGFRGPIYASAPTIDVASIILRDSAKIQEQSTERANKEGYSRHKPALPLYNLEQVERCLEHFVAVEEGEWLDILTPLKIRYSRNGHILGSCAIEIDVKSKRIVFSGDVGRPIDPLLAPPKKLDRADILLLEGTYGDKLHPEEDLEKRLAEIVNQTVKKGGTIIIPSFAVERAQVIMYLLWKLKSSGAIPNIPLILDTPMGTDVLQLFSRHRDWHSLADEEYYAICQSFQIVADYRETWQTVDNPDPKVIVAGSGMLTGGRVLTYLKYYLNKSKHAVVMAGYQAAGTRGRQLLEGSSFIKIDGKYYEVKAQIYSLQDLSAHADQGELLDWLSDIKSTPNHTYIIHAEPHAADALRVRLKDTYGWEAKIPELYQIETLE